MEQEQQQGWKQQLLLLYSLLAKNQTHCVCNSNNKSYDGDAGDDDQENSMTTSCGDYELFGTTKSNNYNGDEDQVKNNVEQGNNNSVKLDDELWW